MCSLCCLIIIIVVSTVSTHSRYSSDLTMKNIINKTFPPSHRFASHIITICMQSAEKERKKNIFHTWQDFNFQHQNSWINFHSLTYFKVVATLIQYSLDYHRCLNLHRICAELSPSASPNLDRIWDERKSHRRYISLMIWLMRRFSDELPMRLNTQILSAMTSMCYMSWAHNDWTAPRRQPTLLVSVRSILDRNSI